MTLANQDVPSNDDAQVRWGFASIGRVILTRLQISVNPFTHRTSRSFQSHTFHSRSGGQQGFIARWRTEEVHPGTRHAVHRAAGSQNTRSFSWDSTRVPAQRSVFKACCDVFFPPLHPFLYPLFLALRYLLPIQFANFPHQGRKTRLWDRCVRVNKTMDFRKIWYEYCACTA